MGDFAPWRFWRCKHAKNSGFTRQHTDRLKVAIVWPKEKPSWNTTAKAVFLVGTQHMAWHEGIWINPLVPLPTPAILNFPGVFSLEILWKNSWLVIKNHPGVSKSPHHQSHSSSLREFGPASGPGIAGWPATVFTVICQELGKKNEDSMACCNSALDLMAGGSSSLSKHCSIFQIQQKSSSSSIESF